MSDAQILEGTPQAEAGTAAAEPAPRETFDQTLERVASEQFDGKRGSDGRFQPKVVARGAPSASEVPGSPTAAPPDPAQPVIEAPQSMPADVKALWSALPSEVQKYWSTRESDIHKKITADGERLKSLGAFEEVAKTLDSRLKQVNAPAPEYFRRLAAADQLLATDGVRGLQEIARMYGIDLRAAFQPAPAGAPNASSPEATQLRSQIESLRQEIKGGKVEAAQRTIDEFKKDKPHFDAVESLMVDLYKPGMDLSALYEMAVRAHPEVSAKIAAEAADAAKKKAEAEAKEKAAKDAKIAPLARRPGSAPTAPLKGKSIWDTMDRVAGEITSRA